MGLSNRLYNGLYHVYTMFIPGYTALNGIQLPVTGGIFNFSRMLDSQVTSVVINIPGLVNIQKAIENGPWK